MLVTTLHTVYIPTKIKVCEKVFPIMSTLLRNKTISKRTPLHKENPFPQFNVACYKHPGIRLSFEYTTTMLSGEGGEGRTGTATIHAFGLFSGCSQISQLVYLLSWTNFDNILLTLHTSCSRKIIHTLLFWIRWIYLRKKKNCSSRECLKGKIIGC